jgi:hypothetical protein
MSWNEQSYLLRALPGRLTGMGLFKVNAVTREQELRGEAHRTSMMLPNK